MGKPWHAAAGSRGDETTVRPTGIEDKRGKLSDPLFLIYLLIALCIF